MLVYPIEAISRFFIFLGIFLYFLETKIYLFEVLKMFLETLSMFFSSLGAKTFLGFFSEIFESIYNILSTKYGFLGFS
jgi:hypothetical protein